MKLTTVGLAIALAIPATLAFAEGTLNYSTAVARPVVRGVTIFRPHSDQASAHLAQEVARAHHA
jgi:hypothetical protein